MKKIKLDIEEHYYESDLRNNNYGLYIGNCRFTFDHLYNVLYKITYAINRDIKNEQTTI